MDKEQLRAKIDEYLETLDYISKDEWWCTDRQGQAVGLEGFFSWLYAEDTEKENRRQQYLTLKAEFEGAAV